MSNSIIQRAMKALGPLKLVLFSDDGIERINRMKINYYAILLLAALIQAVPTPAEPFTFVMHLVTNTIVVTVLLTVLITLLFGISKGLGSSVKFKDYLKRMSLAAFILVLLSIMIAFLIINFGILIGYPEITFKFVQGSMITYYMFVVFGWCAERFAGFDNLKGVLVGVIAIALYYALLMVVSLLP